eukprot:6430360-Amphidinium_carterae.1
MEKTLNSVLYWQTSARVTVTSCWRRCKRVAMRWFLQQRIVKSHRPPTTCLLYTSPSPRDRG